MNADFYSPLGTLPPESGLDSTCGFDEYCDSLAFLAFEKQLECELAILEDRWSGFVTVNANRVASRTRRGNSATNSSPGDKPNKPR